MDPSLPVFDVRTMRDLMSSAVFVYRLSAILLVISGSIALLLAGGGLYGMMAYTVSQQTAEIGLRMALGAQGSAVRRMMIAQSLTLTLRGFVVGAVAAYAIRPFLSEQLVGLPLADPVTPTLVLFLVSGVSMFAAYFPARAASAVDPLRALRSR